MPHMSRLEIFRPALFFAGVKNHWEEQAMTITVSALLGLCATVVGLIAYVVRISMSFSKLQSSQADFQKKIDKLETDFDEVQESNSKIEVLLETNIKRDEEDRRMNSAKFTELFDSRNQMKEVLTDINATMKMLVSNMDDRFKSIEKKIDEIKMCRKQ